MKNLFEPAVKLRDEWRRRANEESDQMRDYIIALNEYVAELEEIIIEYAKFHQIEHRVKKES